MKLSSAKLIKVEGNKFKTDNEALGPRKKIFERVDYASEKN